MNTDQTRHRIRAVIDNGNMLVKDLQDATDAGVGSYGWFMRQDGPEEGMGSDTFHNAHRFSKDREARGVHDCKTPASRKNKSDSSDDKEKDKSSASPDSASKKRKKSGSEDNKMESPSAKKSRKDSLNDDDENKENGPGIALDGEMKDKIPVYESCDVFRRIIDAYLRKSDVTNASVASSPNPTTPRTRT